MFIVSFNGKNEDVSLVIVFFQLSFLDDFKFLDPHILFESFRNDELSLLIHGPLEWLTCRALDVHNLSLRVRFVNVINVPLLQSCLLSDDGLQL